MRGYGFIVAGNSNPLSILLALTWNAAVLFLWAFALTYGVALALSLEPIQ